MVDNLLWIVEVDITRSGKSFVMEDTLVFCVLESFLLDMLFKGDEWAKLTGDGLRHTLDFDLLLAARAAHEGESDSESCPFVLEKLNDAICVEDVTAGKSGASLRSELGSVADCAQLVLINALEKTSSLSAVHI